MEQQRNTYAILGVISLICGLLLGSCHPALSARSLIPAQRAESATRPGSLGPGAASTPIIDRPAATTGCGKPAPLRPGTSADETIISGGLLRRYRLYLPPNYQPDERLPLVLNFHGHGSNAARQERYTGFSTLARQQDFIVAYPQGTIGPDGKTGWASGSPFDPRVNDVRFVSDLLNHLQAELCIDPYRIDATGFSNGGGMVSLLACDLAGRIAAFATVSGSYYPLVDPRSRTCQPPRPVPILEFHGTADRIVPYTGNRVTGLLAVPQWLSAWATRDHCAQGPAIFFQRGNVTGEQWIDCATGGAVIHYRISGGGHIWPGGRVRYFGHGSVTPDISADPLIWQFFQAHPLLIASTRMAL